MIMSKRIPVVFTKDVEGVAKAGELKPVAGGYWRHYLLPRGLAVPDRTGAARKLREMHDKQTAQQAVAKEKTEEGIKQVAARRVAKKGARQAKKAEKKSRAAKKSDKLKKASRGV